MMHLDDGAVQALLDGELGADEADRARRHLEECEPCAEILVELRSAAMALSTALGVLDVATPRGRALAPPPSMVRRRRSWSGGALSRAAMLVLGFAAAASATLPGSPVRGWLAGMIDSRDAMVAVETVAVESAEGPTSTNALSANPSQPEFGVGVAPVAGRIRIIVTNPASGLRIRSRITSAAGGGAYPVGDSANARFESRPGVLEVIDAVGLELRVEIPEAATTATVEIDGRVYVTKEGSQLRLVDPGSALIGAEVLFEVER